MSVARQAVEGRILTPDGWITGRLCFGERVHDIEADAGVRADRLVLPGFIDLHVHGALGVDIMQGGDAATTIARAHARHGTTLLLGTTNHQAADLVVVPGDLVQLLGQLV